MASLLVPITLIAEFLAATAVALSAAFPAHRIWPPPRLLSWRSVAMWFLFGSAAIGVIAIGILDWGSWGLPASIRWGVGVPLWIAGGNLALRAIASMGLARTYGDRGALVRHGPYRFSRNPQYVGFIIALIGWTLVSGAALALPVALAGALACALAPLAEEPWLVERYGEQYEVYRQTVHRYFGLRARPVEETSSRDALPQHSDATAERAQEEKELDAQETTQQIPVHATGAPSSEEQEPGAPMIPSAPVSGEERKPAEAPYLLPKEMRTVEIANRQGDASDYVDASIDDDGALRVMRNSFGPGDYETEVTAIVLAADLDRLLQALAREASLDLALGNLPREDRDLLILRLVKQIWGGDTGAVEAFTAFARVRGIEVGWFRWP